MIKKMNDMERELKDIAAGRRSGTSIASSVGSSEHHPESARTGQLQHLLKHQRTALVVSGFSYDTEREQICATLRDIFGQEPGVKERWAPWKMGSIGKLCFASNADAWSFLRKFAAVAHMGPSKRGSLTGQTSVTGDPNPAHSCCREGLSHTGVRNGQQPRPSVVQKKKEDGGSCSYDLQTNQQLFFGAGVHRRIDARLE